MVFPDKLSLKLLKNVSMETHWHYWTSSKNLCILSTGTYANIFYSFIFKDSTLTKLPKFEVPLHTSPPQMLKQKDIVLITVYGQVYVSHIFNDRGASQSLSVYLYKVKREGIMKATEVLTLSLTLGGKLVLHVVDNLIVLHHQWSKTSYIFDIGLVSSHVMRGGVKYFQPIACHPIRPFTLKDRNSPHWAIFGPDVVLDAKLGCYWNLHLDVENLVSFFDDDVDSIEMLLLRSDSKSLILKLCQEIIESQSESSMVDLKFMSIIFLKFNSILTLKDKDDDEVPKRQLITQKNVFYNLLKPLNDNGVALLLLSVEDEFPAGCQIAYDILKRQSATRECLLEVLLNKKMVLPALRHGTAYAQTYDMIDNLSVRKWFDITMATNDKLLFYHVFNFFANRNLRLRGSTKFIACLYCYWLCVAYL
ncbi:hypothetical protein HELRODRAFT_165214 [Helobdella robusta]|uniref:Mic1 domain-containing protein n=1 Tax=Helobdella robusta TaxID=6412 RepID=T1EWG2_HELRO|nr:hypothetical protein HELRODRAFT_165214 [Helobdella robusta]ESN93055.1 hypothetical protein HELRODRAFT_165214 [Helobdella robusta]